MAASPHRAGTSQDSGRASGGRARFREALAPVLNCGAQGVDLFFILSGFVTDLKLPRPDGTVVPARATLHFLGHVPSRAVASSPRSATSARSCWCGAEPDVVDPLADGWFVGRPEFIGADGVHPTDAGHAYMADKIVPLIRAQLSERY